MEKVFRLMNLKKYLTQVTLQKKRMWSDYSCKRIITEYHMGKIYVHRSIPFKETIIRILLKNKLAGIYIHIPFCYKACYYCDFHFSTSLKLKTELIGAICKEL